MSGKIEAYLGFSIKSNKVVFGFDALCETAKRVSLVVVCPTVNPTNNVLGELIHRDNCKVLAILDKSLANAILNSNEVNIIEKGVL